MNKFDLIEGKGKMFDGVFRTQINRRLTQINADELSDFIALGKRLQIQWRKRPLPIQLFFLLCLNLLIAPAVQAATSIEVSRFQAYALGVLGLTTLGLSVYLFVVIFQPERF
ncbi:K+-transporting ATPase, F subunit [Crinalium epipsammum PCC 9333]|uniref:K+-transporting ATPase, F subunit n=1 Tax=Crinalium epipsammum PCC 9333 TaxID=1173022 RepID=K9VYD1_9CYAN|nr:potassium-transporting ATPase subunit F [Crinalium epipsammum]AFZ12165.1 K+-transporting ATPase, F subunit [Crinalium epipsammum PCC 9333]